MTRPDHPDFSGSDPIDLGDTWDPLDPAVDRRLREIAGEVTLLHAPPQAFERVLVRGRRRRMRTVWTLATASTLTCVLVAGGAIALGSHPQSGAIHAAVGQSTAIVPTAPTATGPSPDRRTAVRSAPATSSATPPSTAAVARCHTADLQASVSVVGGSLSSGHEQMNLTLTNTSGQVCTIFGYPGMQLEDQQSAGQATDVIRTSSGVGAPTRLTLADNASASTTVDFLPDSPDSTEPKSGLCEPESYYLEITPPDENTQLKVQIGGGPVMACQEGALTVYPFVAGATGPEQ
jgi:hypothetical protein